MEEFINKIIERLAWNNSTEETGMNFDDYHVLFITKKGDKIEAIVETDKDYLIKVSFSIFLNYEVKIYSKSDAKVGGLN